MNLAHQINQFHFVTDNSDVNVTPVIISALLNGLSKYSLIPTFGQEINALTGEKRQIISMTNPEETLKVEFPSHAMIISGIGFEYSDFYGKLLKLVNELAVIFPGKKSNRIALTCSKFYFDEESVYEDIYKKLFTHREVNPIEWDNKIVERKTLEKSNESINSISSIRRCEIQTPFIKNGKATDCIIFDLDTNTVPKKTEARFNLADFSIPLSEIFLNNLENMKNLERYTNLGSN